MSVLDKFLDAIRLNDDFVDDDEFFDDEDLEALDEEKPKHRFFKKLDDDDDEDKKDDREKITVSPRLNFALSTYYKGTGLEEVLKKLEEYIDSADKSESDITKI